MLYKAVSGAIVMTVQVAAAVVLGTIAIVVVIDKVNHLKL